MDTSPNAGKLVLVTGAVGQQGGAVVARMLERGWLLRALTRRPDSPESQAIARRGVELVKGDLEDPASLDNAVRGCYGVFSVQDGAVGAEREIQQGKNIADAAKKAGVQHFIYNSVGGADRNTGIDVWERKWKVEQYVRTLGMPTTIFRPVTFFEDYYFDRVELGILMGKLTSPVKPDRIYQMIATADIGKFVTLAFERPEEFIGKELEIAGSALNCVQSAEVFSKVLKKKVTFMNIPMFMGRFLFNSGIYRMFEWYNESGYRADVDGLRKRYPELELKSLEDWLRSEGWHKRAKAFQMTQNGWTIKNR